MKTARCVLARRRWGLIFFVIFAQCYVLAGSEREQVQQGGGEHIDWSNVKQALEIYESCPNEENAKRLLATIPKRPAAHELGNRDAAGMAFLESVPFKKAVIAGDENLAEAAFRMFGYVSGGALDEELTIMLGRLLAKKPALFLILLRKYRHLFPSEGDYPVTMTEIMEIVPDIESEDDACRRDREEIRLYSARIKALESVKDPELIEIRDACIRVVQAIIMRIERRQFVDRVLLLPVTQTGLTDRFINPNGWNLPDPHRLNFVSVEKVHYPGVSSAIIAELRVFDVNPVEPYYIKNPLMTVGGHLHYDIDVREEVVGLTTYKGEDGRILCYRFDRILSGFMPGMEKKAAGIPASSLIIDGGQAVFIFDADNDGINESMILAPFKRAEERELLASLLKCLLGSRHGQDFPCGLAFIPLSPSLAIQISEYFDIRIED